MALPILAIVWGAKITDITELWAQFREGFSIGATQISPTSFLLFAMIFAIGYTITKLVQAALRTTVLPRTKMDAGGQNAIVAGTGYVGIFLAAIVAISTAGIDLSWLSFLGGGRGGAVEGKAVLVLPRKRRSHGQPRPSRQTVQSTMQVLDSEDVLAASSYRHILS